ncbi:transposase [Massilia sp. LXY-6]|uniref:IS701 family transposase n=1 Tax=Massilia sp. LXY-6 TaxID=3379823 RepID=UPI003EE422B2
MATISSGLTRAIVGLSDLFSKRAWPLVQVLLAGAILAVGPRTVSAVLRVMGLSQERQFQKYHRVLNRVKWSTLGGGRRLLKLLIEAFAPDGPLIMALDDTIERRRGAKIAAKGIYRDPVRSSHGHFVKASGLRWLCLMLVAPIPWANRCWALPFCTVLAPSERYYLQRGRRPNKLTDRARQLLLMVKRWVPERSIVVVADSSFAALELLDAVRRKVCVITRLRLDAALFDPAPQRAPGTIGRPRRKGERQPTLKAISTAKDTHWRAVRLHQWYGQGDKVVEIATGTAVWFHKALPTIPLRWVLVRDPQHKLTPQAFLCTDETVEPEQILAWFIRRWQIEVTFEARAHLGMETQRQWSDRAIACTTPVILGLYSIVSLTARQLVPQDGLMSRHAAWYAKDSPTFSDTIALVRRSLWSEAIYGGSGRQGDMLKIPRALFDRLTETVCYAA